MRKVVGIMLQILCCILICGYVYLLWIGDPRVETMESAAFLVIIAIAGVVGAVWAD